jgi:carbonic anhydrase
MFATPPRQPTPRSLGRRSFLTAATIGCVFCRMALRASAQEAHATPHWAYEGEAGASHWGELSLAFKACEFGTEQSPIDLGTAVTAQLGSTDIAWQPMPLRIVNNGHTIQINATPGSFCNVGGTRYEMLQFHFHHPSEHLLSGKPFDLECHFVHRSAAGGTTVIGVFVRPGETNPTLAPIWSALPPREGPERDAGISIDAAGLLPAERGYFRYMGSLTTPPCSEGITWTVFRTSIEASSDQIRQFAALFASNARPVQGRNRRFLVQTS